MTSSSGGRTITGGSGGSGGSAAAFQAGLAALSDVSSMLARSVRPRTLSPVLTVSGSVDDESLYVQRSSSLTEQKRFNRAVRRTGRSLRTNTPLRNDERCLALLVKSRGFNIGIACLIVISTVMIGIEAQLLSSLSSQAGSSSEQLETALAAMNYAVTLMFTVEMVARLYVFKLDFFVHERVWNLFDAIILLLALVEVALELVVYAFPSIRDDMFDGGGSAKVLRLFRLTRLLRLVRTFRQLKPLRLLLHSLYCAGRSVVWALLLLFTIVYSFGVILTQAVTEHTESGTRVEDEDLMSYYGNLYRSMKSLWWAVSGGISWYELTDPLERTGNAVWSMLFLVYIAFVYFFILNVVTCLVGLGNGRAVFFWFSYT